MRGAFRRFFSAGLGNAVRAYRAFNDYVSERYRKIDGRLQTMGSITMQDIKAAVYEEAANLGRCWESTADRASDSALAITGP